jgi:hypothetical protein
MALENDTEWIEAHVENAVRDGKHLGRLEVFNFHPAYFRAIASSEKRDAEIKKFIESARHVEYAPCRNLTCLNTPIYCMEKNKPIGYSLDKIRKLDSCKDHACFTDCTEVKNSL